MSADVGTFLVHLTFIGVGVGLALVALPGAFIDPVKETLWGLRAIFGPGGKG